MKLTTVNDYVDIVHEQFPELTRDEIKRILNYGWKMILQYKSFGNDIQVLTPNLFFYIGQIPNNALTLFKTYCYKLAKRVQYMFKRTQSEWDGYYYFARTELQYKEYLTQTKKRYKVFPNVMLYKLLDECKISEHAKPYIFRLKEDKTMWMKKFYKEIRTKNAELVLAREPLNMKTLMTSTNKYKYIQQ